MDNCIFCKIIKGEIPCTKIYENDKVLAFLDIEPINKGHTLIIPKEHSQNIYETSDENLSEIIKIAKKISIAIKTTMKADGINVHMNNNHAAGQRVFHTHIHIIPRYDNDGLDMWHSKEGYTDKEKKEIAELISKEIK
ncbi:MAG: HIT family protein [Candidatus Nomurabacteria bacterium]|nr:HIT family protein [Candidatus Nomurabacteria bacterium]